MTKESGCGTANLLAAHKYDIRTMHTHTGAHTLVLSLENFPLQCFSFSFNIINSLCCGRGKGGKAGNEKPTKTSRREFAVLAKTIERCYVYRNTLFYTVAIGMGARKCSKYCRSYALHTLFDLCAFCILLLCRYCVLLLPIFAR